ncbi:galactokinase [Ideonella sp. BN130291]|uniref:galactokinase n=1 Tax=Ideonella sp. BN130291 TaxID=3112940 RepID=UPI002E26864B|nr:galactokinase [Ideonella sp. BN130291]
MTTNPASFDRAQLLARALNAFHGRFGGEPRLLARAPGRVNLIGEHTDYSDGFCLPCAIDRETLLLLRPRHDGRVRVLACDEGSELDSFSLTQPIQPREPAGWANYVRGTLAALQADGVKLQGADIAIAGNVPLGAGLSSSAALEMAVATAFDALAGTGLDVRRKARAGQWAEHHFAGCQCGILDQLASAAGVAGHALLLDCRTQETQAIPLPPDLAVLVIHSRVQRGLVDSEYNLRRQQCQQAAAALGVPLLRDVDKALWQARAHELPLPLLRRARHVVTENQRTLDAAQALRDGDLQRAGELMRESHVSMRDDFEIVPPAVDRLAMIVNEVLGPQGGARMTGGGFGGCVVALVPHGRVASVRSAVERGYRSPGGEPALVWACSASAGAGLLA